MAEAGTRSLAGRTIVMSGGSRGIGLAIALRAAGDGANVTLIAKTDHPHPRLRGTIHDAAAAIEAAGGRALPVVGDIRDDDTIAAAVEQTIATFGGIDACINNASVLDLSGTEELPPKRYDLMQDVNVRGTFMLTRACLPHLRRAPEPHVLTLSPPLNLAPHWTGKHVGYLLAKYGMSLATIGFAAELESDGIAVNSLWPRTIISTDAVGNIHGGRDAFARARTPAIMADAAYAVLTTPARKRTGQLMLDDDVLRASGLSDLDTYAEAGPAAELELDIFVDSF